MSIEFKAKIISEWTKSSKSMLPKTPKEIEVLIKDGRAVVIEDENGSPLAFGAQTFNWSDGWVELGAVVVDPGNRNKGLGSLVVTRLVEKAKAEGGKPFALCNANSMSLFLKNGGVEITDPNELPNEVWGECVNNCPNFKKARDAGRHCCDTPVKIK